MLILYRPIRKVLDRFIYEEKREKATKEKAGEIHYSTPGSLQS